MTTPTSRPRNTLLPIQEHEPEIGKTARPSDANRTEDRYTATDGGLPPLTQTRQVLVDGTNIPALTIAALLQQAGHEPVLVDRPNEQQSPPVTTLLPPGLHILDTIGISDRIRNPGQQLNAVTVRPANGESKRCQTFTTSHDELTPFLVDTRALLDAFAEQVSDVPRLSNNVVAVTEHANTLEVEFANGVREFFDLAVATSGPASIIRSSFVDERPQWTPLSTLEVPLDDVDTVPALPLDSWQDGVVVQLLPPPNADANGVLRLLTSPDMVEDVDVTGIVMAAFPDVAEDATTAWTASLNAAEWRQVPQARADTAAWTAGHVAYCGAAAFPAPRITGVQPTLAIEDAWVLADELARDPDDIAASLTAYAKRRQERLQAFFGRLSTVDTANSYPAAREEPLTTTSLLRAITLGVLSVGPLEALYRDVPARL